MDHEINVPKRVSSAQRQAHLVPSSTGKDEDRGQIKTPAPL